MPSFQKHLADSLIRARKERHLSQSKVANVIDVDKRTILNIEKGKGNPKLDILFRLVRFLNIDPWEFFYPDIPHQNPTVHKFETILSGCNEVEIEALYSICQEVIRVMRLNTSNHI